MKEKTLQVMADIDASMLLDLLDEDIEAIATLATDAEITRQFETIQKELEGVITQHLKVYMKELIYNSYKELFDKYYLESGERR